MWTPLWGRSRLLRLIMQWMEPGPEPPRLDEPPGFTSGVSRDEREHCFTCSEETEFRKLDEEERLFYQVSGDPNDHLLRRCTTDGCLAVKYVMGAADTEASLLLPERTGPRASETFAAPSPTARMGARMPW